MADIYGMRVWDAQANLILDVSDRITKVLGETVFNVIANQINTFNIASPIGNVMKAWACFQPSSLSDVPLGCSMVVTNTATTITLKIEVINTAVISEIYPITIMYGVY